MCTFSIEGHVVNVYKFSGVGKDTFFGYLVVKVFYTRVWVLLTTRRQKKTLQSFPNLLIEPSSDICICSASILNHVSPWVFLIHNFMLTKWFICLILMWNLCVPLLSSHQPKRGSSDNCVGL